MKLKIYILCLFFSFFSQLSFGQRIGSAETADEFKSAIISFFTEIGEIDAEHKLGISCNEIAGGKEIGHQEVGIYIIKTVYRTDGHDYVLLKNGKNFEIVEFDDLKKLLAKSLSLLSQKSDDEVFLYMNKLLEWYDGSYLYRRNHRTSITKKEKPSED